MLNERSVLNRSITIHALAVAAARAIDDRIPVGAIHDSYNGDLDVYVDAFSIASMKATGTLDTPGRNDGIDLNHLVYLRRCSVLVSEDVKQRGYLDAVNVRTLTLGQRLHQVRERAGRRK